MKQQYQITYLSCQSCTAKIHCEKCGAELCERLLQDPKIQSIQIDIPNRQLCVDSAYPDEMDLLDLLEEAGVFAD